MQMPFASLAAAVVLFATTSVVMNRIDLYMLTRSHVLVKSTVNGLAYSVLDKPEKQAAADLLARVRAACVMVIHEVERMVHARGLAGIDSEVREGVKRLLRLMPNGDNLTLYEMDYSKEDQIAYNRNKTDGIFVCLRRDVTTGELADDDTVLYIVLHEIGHTMTPHFDPMVGGGTVHSPLFRKHEAYLHGVAERLGMLNRASIPGRVHCRSVLTKPDESK